MAAFITIDAGTFARNAIQAIHAGEVAFLDASLRRYQRCDYFYPSTGHRCIIGAGLPVKGAQDLERLYGGPVGELLADQTLVVTSDTCEPEALRITLCELQRMHDSILLVDATDDQVLDAKVKMLTELELLADLHPEPQE